MWLPKVSAISRPGEPLVGSDRARRARAPSGLVGQFRPLPDELPFGPRLLLDAGMTAAADRLQVLGVVRSAQPARQPVMRDQVLARAAVDAPRPGGGDRRKGPPRE